MSGCVFPQRAICGGQGPLLFLPQRVYYEPEWCLQLGYPLLLRSHAIYLSLYKLILLCIVFSKRFLCKLSKAQ
ncbi:MAG: hypothetical protein EBV84_11400 [Betaproteobacteria bacterium]|nr:hypothetical protein [Betaproteobacteria bacterium]NBP37510.1 hypothetical protein [Betaproteobacteria bacterium]NCW25961.1 hypothetical protein [Betaproteobacteria bacterium]